MNPELDAVVTRVRSLLPERGRVLDAGCGDAALTFALDDAGITVIGLDKDLDAIRPASEERPKVPFFLDDLTSLDLPMGLVGRGFDVIVLKDVLGPMGLAELDAALAGCATLVADDGVLLATVPAGSIGTTVRTAEKAGWAEQARGDWSGGPAAEGADVVLQLGRAPEKKPSRLRSLLRR